MPGIWVCAKCRCRYRAGAPCCPECRATAHTKGDEMPKINAQGVASYENDARRAVAHPADGTLSSPVSNAPAPGEAAGGQVAEAPAAPAEAEGAAAPDAATGPAKAAPESAAAELAAIKSASAPKPSRPPKAKG